MDFINEIQYHLSEGIENALREKTELDKILFSVLELLLSPNDDNEVPKCKAISGICEDVVYFVLNVTDIRKEKRAFQAGINWANLDCNVKELKLIDDIDDNYIPQGTTDIVSFTTKDDDPPSETQKKYLREAWRKLWDEYYNITVEYEKSDKYTFNQWLLRHLKHPLNVGVYWGAEDNSTNDNYIHISKATIKNLGLNLSQPDATALYRTSQDFSEDNIQRIRNVVKMEEMFTKMDPIKTGYIIHDNIPFCIYYLIKYYGCWGGNSFYSIPINYGNSKDPRRGILSVCTTRPMNSDLAQKWYIVANKIFKDIILHEINLFKEYERKNQLIEATYGIGHLFGNTIKEMETPFTTLINRINSLEIPNTFKNSIKYNVKEIGTGFAKLKDVSTILHMFSKVLVESGQNIFERSGWHSTNKAIDLYNMIDELNNKSIRIGIGEQKCRIEFPDIKSIKINSFEIGNRTILPSEFIYNNLLLEILINCIKHHSKEVVDKKLIIMYDESKLIFQNVANTDGKFTDWEEISLGNSKGAILYYNYFFKESQIGKLYRRQYYKNKVIYFELGVELNGLTLLNKE